MHLNTVVKLWIWYQVKYLRFAAAAEVRLSVLYGFTSSKNFLSCENNYVLKIKTSFFSYTQDQFATLTSCRPREINEKMKKHENNRFFILIIYYTQGNYASLNFCKTESRLNTCVDPLIAESILGQPAPLLDESGRMAPIELPSSPVNELFCTAVHYTTPHGTTLHYTILWSALPLIRVQIRQTEQNKRGKKDMIIAPSGNKDCGIRMFGILVWIRKLFSHPLFKRPYSLTFCWAWFVTKLNKIEKKRCVSDHIQYLTRTTN